MKPGILNNAVQLGTVCSLVDRQTTYNINFQNITEDTDIIISRKIKYLYSTTIVRYNRIYKTKYSNTESYIFINKYLVFLFSALGKKFYRIQLNAQKFLEIKLLK